MQKRSLLLTTQITSSLTLMILFAFNSSFRGSEYVKFITYHFSFVFPCLLRINFYGPAQWNLESSQPITTINIAFFLNGPIRSITRVSYNWHFDSEDDYRTGCQNISHRQQQQSYSALRSSGRSCFTYLRVCFKFWDVISQNN